MKTTTVELSLRDLTCLLRSLRETGDALAKRIGDEEDDVHGDLMLVDDLIARLKAEHTKLFEAKRGSAA